MPATTAPESPAADSVPQEGPAVRRSPWRTIGWIALWTCLALILLSFVLAAFLVGGGSSDDSRSASVEATDEPAESLAPDDADTTTAEMTEPASLTVDSLEPGDLFVSGSSFFGTTSSDTIEYRLLAGGTVVAEGSVDVVDGTFSATVDFTNTCCIEMLLEVTQPGDAGLSLSVPLAFPEPG